MSNQIHPHLPFKTVLPCLGIHELDSTFKTRTTGDFGAKIPIYSMAVQCGLFGISDDHIENYLSLDEKFIKNKHATYIFKMEGKSMEPYIYHGDYLIVDRSHSSYLNKIVIVDIFDERLCKYMVSEQGRIILRSLNPKMQDIIVTDEMNLRVFGVAILCFKDLLKIKENPL